MTYSPDPPATPPDTLPAIPSDTLPPDHRLAAPKSANTLSLLISFPLRVPTPHSLLCVCLTPGTQIPAPMGTRQQPRLPTRTARPSTSPPCPLSPLLPKALAWVPLEPSVCSFTSNPPEVGGPAAQELRALGESRPRNAEPQPPRMPPSGRLPGTAMPPGSLCLFLAAGANTPAETLNPRRAESKGQF